MRWNSVDGSSALWIRIGCCKAVFVHATSDPGSHCKHVCDFAPQLLTLPTTAQIRGLYARLQIISDFPGARARYEYPTRRADVDLHWPSRSSSGFHFRSSRSYIGRYVYIMGNIFCRSHSFLPVKIRDHAGHRNSQIFPVPGHTSKQLILAPRRRIESA